MNFLKQYAGAHKKKNEKEKKLGINVVPIIITAIVMAVLIGSAVTVMLLRKMKLDDLKEYNSNPQIVMSVAEYDMLIGRNNYLYAQYAAIADVEENIHTYPVCDSNIISKIEACAKGYATVTFDSFDAEEGTIQMTASSDSVDNINLFIKQLNEQDIFNNVDYTGYAFNDTTANWDIHVTCTLAESAGR